VAPVARAAPDRVMTFGRHRYNRDLDNEGGWSLARLARWVPERATVLELGPASGYFTRHLSEVRGCIVDAIELDPEMAELARPWCRHLIVGDLETLRLKDSLPAGSSYQTIVAADVLEHLRDPGEILLQLKELLAPNGQILISVPNVAYAGLVADLIAGEFIYRDEGLLDRTHLRFFTRGSLAALLREAGLHPWLWEAVVRPLGESEFDARLNRLPHGLVDALTANPHALCYQWLTAARTSVPPAVPAEPPPSRADLFPVRVFWAEPESEFCYESSAVAWAEIGSEKQTLDVALPSIRQARLRLCLADRPGFVHLFAASLNSAEGTVLWSWDWKDGAQRLGVQSHDVVLQNGDECVLATLHAAESWLELPISVGDIPAAAILRLQLGWPMSPDFLAARQGWQDAAGRLQAELGEARAIVAERDRQLQELNAAREERERIIAERDRQLAEVNAARVQREGMIAERDAELSRRAEAAAELGKTVAVQASAMAAQERTKAPLETKLSGLEAERARQDAALAAQERAIAYLQSFRGWLALPSRRLRRWLGR
jgi:2-polyprenyl-3-methyl-5-hydroxy-6-metoxy-1,4-benzoquinol methylase